MGALMASLRFPRLVEAFDCGLVTFVETAYRVLPRLRFGHDDDRPVEDVAEACEHATLHVNMVTGVAVCNGCGEEGTFTPELAAAVAGYEPLPTGVTSWLPTVPAGVSTSEAVPPAGPPSHPLVTGETPTPAAVVADPVDSGTGVGPPASFVDWIVPAICDVLAEHHPLKTLEHNGSVVCENSVGIQHGYWPDRMFWREHVSVFIAERIESCCLAIKPRVETGYDLGVNLAAATEFFPQATKPRK